MTIPQKAFTPGPWVRTEDLSSNKGYKTWVGTPERFGQPHTSTPIAHVWSNWRDAGAQERRISWKEAEANALLIAAAPELLAALEACRDLLDDIHHRHVRCHGPAYNAAVSAISLATGGES